MPTAERGLTAFLPTSLMKVTTEHPGAVAQKHGWPDWDMCKWEVRSRRQNDHTFENNAATGGFVSAGVWNQFPPRITHHCETVVARN